MMPVPLTFYSMHSQSKLPPRKRREFCFELRR